MIALRKTNAWYRRLAGIISLLFCVGFLCFASPVKAETSFTVVKVIDGDTIVVDIRGKKEVVRLLGIDTPETVDPRNPVQCFGREASNKMKSFVTGKSVVLIDDKTQGNRDKYKRLLRYVYLQDSVHTFVNGEMVKQGYAFSYKQYPTSMLAKFNTLEQYAREHNLGLWGACQQKKPATTTQKPTVKNNTVIQTQTQLKTQETTTQTTGQTGGFTCSGKNTCGQMTSCAEAQFYLTTCGVSRLDADKDGVPCESLCR